MKTAEERFAEKWREDENGCHVWTAAKISNGYGYFHLGTGRLAHRVAWEWANGPVPEGEQLDHLCRNRACVNVKHLEPVTCRENVLRGVGVSALNSKKTQCPRGHAFSEKVKVRNGKPASRQCLECNRVSASALRQRRKQAKSAMAIDFLFGQWPGDETDAQLAVALRGSQ